MNTTIRIEIRNVYGELKAYPLCEKASLFAAIAGTKTLTRSTLMQILAIGFSIEVVGQGSRTYRPLDAGYSSTLPMVA